MRLSSICTALVLHLCALQLSTTARADTPALGTLKVETEPPGVLVFVDGQPVGKSPVTHHLPPGTYVLAYHYEGNHYEPEVIQVAAGQVLEKRLTLRLPPPGAERPADQQAAQLRLDAALGDAREALARCVARQTMGGRELTLDLQVDIDAAGQTTVEPTAPPDLQPFERVCIEVVVRREVKDEPGLRGPARLRFQLTIL